MRTGGTRAGRDSALCPLISALWAKRTPVPHSERGFVSVDPLLGYYRTPTTTNRYAATGISSIAAVVK